MTGAGHGVGVGAGVGAGGAGVGAGGRRWGPHPDEEEPRVPVSPTGSVTYGFLDHYSRQGAPPGSSNLKQ